MTEFSTQARFAFGQNWLNFVREDLSDESVHAAIADLKIRLRRESLEGLTFLDIGCGSGLSSLAAYRLGARVVAFDYDPESVASSEILRSRFAPEAGDRWCISQGSILDERFLANLPKADVIYSWGVLHHTGDMWRALENCARLVPRESLLFIALYNDQGLASKIWLQIKRAYVASGPLGRGLMLTGVGTYFSARRFAGAVLQSVVLGRERGQKRGSSRVQPGRGMNRSKDLIDWVGGYPFEVSTPHDVFAWLCAKGFVMTDMLTCGGGHGCNVFVAIRRT